MPSRFAEPAPAYTQSEEFNDIQCPPSTTAHSILTAPSPTMSTLPLSPTRRQIDSPSTPVEGVSAPLLAPGSSNSSGQTSPDLGTSPLSCATPSSLPFRAAPPRYSPAAYVPRHGFAGARESSSGYASSVPSSIRTTPQSVRPQAAFLLPPETDSFVSFRTSGTSDFNDLDRYIGTAPSGHTPSPRLSDAYSLDADPTRWGTVNDSTESDDELHNPDPRRDRTYDRDRSFNARGVINGGCLVLVILGLITLLGGYPIFAYYFRTPQSTLGAYNLGGLNASGQVPEMLGHRGLIDPATPSSAYTRTSSVDGQSYDLVFSDEFNVEGRSFYPGDDPYWEAVDLHYWATGNLEWYDPSQVTTEGGSLKITLARKREHDLDYAGGMVSTWNKFCFTGGYLEANVSLPGSSRTFGLWPAFWAMGNLGRAGYGASLEGLWPYTYDSCDVGTLPNQTDPFTNLPEAAHVGGPKKTKGELSYLQGQRLSACTCASESDGTDGQQMVHPGPRRSDRSFVGRGAPEIDVFEALVNQGTLTGEVSQSCQWAPFNADLKWDNSSTNLIIADPTRSTFNTWPGNEFQQTSSVLSNTNQDCYTQGAGCFTTYGFEYAPGKDGYIEWVNDAKPAWQIRAAGMGPDSRTMVGARPVPEEPLYILANLGISYGFGGIDFENLVFPVYMLIDYVRVYQPSNKRNIGCDPPSFPTANYINTYIEAYTNPNLTTWVDDYKQRIPKNKLVDAC
ncbi:hypothetical protein FRC12_004967 [Ceratobasidium sp. 428]|nr:hypothetical protein FRC12_004967 [Ceratobasidium sp. 428]